MKLLRTLLVLFLCASAHAEDSVTMSLTELINSKEAQAVMAPEVKLFWFATPYPSIAEKNIQDTYSGGMMGAVTDERCKKAFVAALKNLVGTAQTSGFDLATGIRVMEGKTPTNSENTFSCSSGSAATSISLQATLALSSEHAKRIESSSARPAIRKEAPSGAISIPWKDVASMPEMKKLLGANRTAYWELMPSPKFSERFGPETYSAKIYANSRDEMEPIDRCKQASLKIIKEMVSYADEYKHDAIIRMHSWLAEQRAENAENFECQVDRQKNVKVELRATTAKLIPASMN